MAALWTYFMLQRDRQIRTQIQQLADACLFAVSLWLAYAFRENETLSLWLGLDLISPDAFERVVWLYFALVPAAPLVLESQGFYNRPMAASRTTLFWPLAKSTCIITVGIVVLLFIFRETSPRGVALLFSGFSFGLVWFKEEMIQLVLRSKVARAQYKRRIIITGTVAETARLRRELAARAADSIEVAAEFNLAETPVQGLIELLHEHSVCGVLVSTRRANMEQVENVIKLCEIEGVETWLMADFFATQIAHASFDDLYGHPLIVFRSAPETSWQMLAKLLLDFFGAALLIGLISPLLLLLALLVKFTSPGPVLFRQQRSGLNGAPFTIYKFRTMKTNAEQMKHELAAMNEMSGPVFKVTNDPRVTRIGKWLRKWSLDELPQLFNVVRGEMSLVGPRPLPVDEVKRFSDLAHRRRLSVKPGLTCLWQIKGRNQISDFKEWVRLDLEYIDNWSFWLDLRILLSTIPAVLRGTGAK
jgi:exopolysaccharide biosynthesis polyprenyl glycosylphosphotransferase